jgi:hypothetical protein
MIRKLALKSIGQIQEVAVEFGDMTILTGPQATGKTIFLQYLKLVQDYGPIARDIRTYGFDWRGEWMEFLSLYLGEGQSKGWSAKSAIEVDGKAFSISDKLTGLGRRSLEEKVLLIPAQRATIFRNGWPRAFLDFGRDEPYSVGAFSESIRLSLEGKLPDQGKSLVGTWRRSLSKSWADSVFHQATLALAREGNQRKLVLDLDKEQRIPFSGWSTGQREFTPLLLSLTWLKRTATRHETVIVEEPEAGLHPKAILSAMALLFELLSRGKNVVVSTHSPAVLDVVWAFQELRRNCKDPKVLAKACQELFDVRRGAFDWELLRKSRFRTYHFHPETRTGRTTSLDISSLDPGDENALVSGWGGLTGFSGKAASLVAQSVNARAR